MIADAVPPVARRFHGSAFRWNWRRDRHSTGQLSPMP